MPRGMLKRRIDGLPGTGIVDEDHRGDSHSAKCIERP
jgi:hypothetical protein